MGQLIKSHSKGVHRRWEAPQSSLHEVLGEDMMNEDGDYPYEGRRPAYESRRTDFHRDRRQWEAGMRIEIPEFHGILQPEELLDWLAIVEEVLELKGVPEDNEFNWSQPDFVEERQHGGNN